MKYRCFRTQSRLAPVCAALAAGSLIVSGCGGGGSNDGQGGSGPGGEGGSGGTVNVDYDPPDRSHISYVENLLAKIDAGDWTLSEGLVETLKLFVGEEEESNVLLQSELLSYEGTGIVAMANDYLRDGEDAAAQGEISRLLGFLIFSAEQLEAMAGLTAKSNGGATSQRVAKGAGAQDCAAFYHPADLPPGVSTCLEVESEMIGEDVFRIFRPADGLPSGGWDDGHVMLTQQAIRDSVPVFEGLGEMPPANIIFSVANGGRIRGAAAPQETTCTIALFASLQTHPPDEFRQLVAHELAHCFQVATVPQVHVALYPVTKWREEGLAEYFSNVVYPSVNFEWRWNDDFRNQELQNTLFDRDYENFIFFQFLANVIGNDGILSVLRAMPEDRGAVRDDEEAALASVSDMDLTFHEFTKAVTDVQVTDTGGEIIPIEPLASSVEITAAATPIATATRVSPFGANRLLVGVREDRKQARLDLTLRNLTIDSSRPASGPLAVGFGGFVTESIGGFARPWSGGVPPRLPETECNTAWRILVTSTAEPDGGFDLDVPDVEDYECCLHGRWQVDNEDIAAHDEPVLGVDVTISGSLTGEFRGDGTVLFEWADHTRESVDNFSMLCPGGTVTTVANGASTQLYGVRFGELLLFGGPELTPNIRATDACGMATEGVMPLDTWVGDAQTSQFYTCEGDNMITTVTNPFGEFDFVWTRQN